MSEVATLVPLSAHLDEHRLRAWRFVRSRLMADDTFWPIITGDCYGEKWSKGDAVARAREVVGADVLVVHDADVLVDSSALRSAIDACARGAAWAIPHGRVYRLTERSTARAYDGEAHILDHVRDLARPPYTGIAGGGITVLRSEVWDDCPMDSRFHGWGSEDECWGWALATLHGEPWRSDAPLTHFWHPHPAPGSRRGTSAESHMLWRTYRYARRRPERMRAVIDGARAAAATALRSPPCLGTSSSAGPNGVS